MNNISKLEARFWLKVDRKAKDECWEWTASKGKKGYGQILLNGRPQGAHRISWQLHNGPIPDGLFVCHSCDNPGCVNPAHLFLGTARDNTQDMLSKDREASGEKSGARKLSERDVVMIRRAYSYDRMDVRTLANRYEVSRTEVLRIVCGRLWKKAPGPISKSPGLPTVLTEEQVKGIYSLVMEGSGHQEIAAEYGVSVSTVSDIQNGKTWKHVTGATSTNKRKTIVKKVDESMVLEIRRLRNDLNLPLKEVAQKLGVKVGVVSDVSKGRSWVHVGGTIRAGGQAQGESRSNSKLDADKVLEIRRLHKLGETGKRLSQMFSVSPGIISGVINRKLWTHV